jgi:hypothetical protein
MLEGKLIDKGIVGKRKFWRVWIYRFYSELWCSKIEEDIRLSRLLTLVDLGSKFTQHCLL